MGGVGGRGLVWYSDLCSDLAQHYLVKANISAIRRVRKSDNNRIARWGGGGLSVVCVLAWQRDT